MSRRKNVGRLKGLPEGSSVLFFKGQLDPNAKVKVLPRKEIKLARGANVFLVRNYERVRFIKTQLKLVDHYVGLWFPFVNFLPYLIPIVRTMRNG